MFTRIGLALALVLTRTAVQAQTITPPPKIIRTLGPPPTDVVATASDGFSILVRWSRGPGSAGSAVYLSAHADTGFRRIWIDSTPAVVANTYSTAAGGVPPSSPSGQGNTISTRIMPSYIATNLLPSTTFYIKVAAWYADGREGQSPAVAATTLAPPPPPNLKAVTKPRTVSLTWDPAVNASAYRVVRNGQRIVELHPGTYADGVHLKTGYDDDVDLNTAYTYQVQAVYTYPFLPERIGTASVSTKTPWMVCLPVSR